MTQTTDTGTSSPPASDVQQIDPRRLSVLEERATAQYEDGQREALKADIARRGIQEPLTVWEIDGDLVVSDGFNRASIALELGLPAVPCRVKAGTLREAMLDNLAANHKRGKNRPQDMALVVVALGRDHGATPAEIAHETGLREAWIKKLLRLKDLHADVLAGLDAGTVSVGVALELARLPTPESQLQSYTLAMHHGWTVGHAEAMVDAIQIEIAKPAAERVPIAAVEPARPVCPLCERSAEPATMTSALVCTPCWGLAVFAVREAAAPGRGAA
jgi:ParB-like chromosome segregation protein Spo0J